MKTAKQPRAKDIQVGDTLFDCIVLDRFEGHYLYLGNYVRFQLSDGSVVELRWRERPTVRKAFAFDSP